MMQQLKQGWLGTAMLLALTSGVAVRAQDAPAAPQTPGVGGGQGRGGGRQGFGRGQQQQISLATIPNDVLTDNLKLTADQKTKIAPIHDKYMTDSRALRPMPGAQVDRETRRANQQKLRDLTEQANKDVDAVLTDDQKKMVPDLIKDLQTFSAADLPFALRAKLNLTDEQKTKMAKAQTDSRDAMQQKMQDARQSGDRAKMQEVQTEATKDLHEKVLAILTADQKTMVTDYEKAHPRRTAPAGRPVGAGSDTNA